MKRVIPILAFSFLGLIVLAAVVNLVNRVTAAPALKDRDVVVIAGPIQRGMGDGPIIQLPAADGEPDRTFWLVFTDPAMEQQARKFELGARVRVTGKLANGGDWRYVVVSSIGKDE